MQLCNITSRLLIIARLSGGNKTTGTTQKCAISCICVCYFLVFSCCLHSGIMIIKRSKEKILHSFYRRHLLVRLGLNDNMYNGHSFRTGAATSAAKAGTDGHLIQTLCRLSSNCYTR